MRAKNKHLLSLKCLDIQIQDALQNVMEFVGAVDFKVKLSSEEHLVQLLIHDPLLQISSQCSRKI